MKRFLICALAVGLLAGTAMAQAPTTTVWVQGADGSNKVTLGLSETAVIQLWASVSGGADNRPLVNVSAALRGYTAAFGKNLSYDVTGFNDITISNSQMQRGGRGPNQPATHMDEYAFFAEDPTSLNGTDGLGNTGTARSFLLDEIIIHGTVQNDFTDEGGAKNSDIVVFAFPPTSPTGFYMLTSGLPPSWSIGQLPSVGMGTGNNDSAANYFLVNVTPEPATLGLIALGGLAAIRRRR